MVPKNIRKVVYSLTSLFNSILDSDKMRSNWTKPGTPGDALSVKWLGTWRTVMKMLTFYRINIIWHRKCQHFYNWFLFHRCTWIKSITCMSWISHPRYYFLHNKDAILKPPAPINFFRLKRLIRRDAWAIPAHYQVCHRSWPVYRIVKIKCANCK